MFYVPFNIVYVISRLWKCDNGRLCAMKYHSHEWRDSTPVHLIQSLEALTTWPPGPSCSKLTMSLVNDSLKFTLSDMQMCWNFLLKKMWVANFCSSKATHIFSAKNIRILYIESAKTVYEMTLNELVKLMTLWTTGPWSLLIGVDLPKLIRHFGRYERGTTTYIAQHFH